MNDFILKMDSLLINEQYDKRYILEVLIDIKDYFKADACYYDMLEISGEEIYTNKINQIENTREIIINHLHIYNPKVEVTDYMVSFLTIYQNNLNQLYKLWKNSNIDKLTNVHNFNALNEKIKKSRIFNNVGVAFVDADGLSVINNTYGHEEGDRLLKTIVLIISKVFRQRDIYRKGGDEFVLLCENIPEKLFYDKINMVKELILKTNNSASIGAVYAVQTFNIEENIKQADQKMYEEKRRHKLGHPDNRYNTLGVYEPNKKGR